MTKQEIYIVNRALDGRDIYAMPSLDSCHFSELLIDSYKDKLIKKNILVNKKAFTEIGIVFASRLKKYKEARKYVSINNITIAMDHTDIGVVLLYNPLLDDYKLDTVGVKDCASVILSVFPFLLSEDIFDECVVDMISEREMKQRYKYKYDQSLHLKVHSEKVDTEEIIFNYRDELYVYDCKSGRLMRKGGKSIQMLVKERVKQSE